MGRTYNTNGKDEHCIQKFLSENLKRRDHLEDPGVYGRIILNLILQKLDRKVWPGLDSYGSICSP
jgi:hypothetical protein